MINNKYIYPYNEIEYNSTTPVKFMQIPITIDNMDNSELIEIKVSAVSPTFTTECNFVIRTMYTANNSSYTVSLFRKSGGDCRVNIKGYRKDNILYLYALTASSLSGSKVFVKIESSTTNQYLFTNVAETIPTDGTTYDLQETSLNLATGITLNASYPDASMIKNDFISISCAITVSSTLAANSALFTGLSAYRINGIAMKIDGSVLSPLRRSSSNLINVNELAAGTYIILANGTVNNSLKPNF